MSDQISELQESREEILASAISAQKKGDLENAKHRYLNFLSVEPHHPTANHNLGVIVEKARGPEDALPMFKRAVAAEPNNERYWVSYIQTMIKACQLEAAASALLDAKRFGVPAVLIAALDELITRGVSSSEQKEVQYEDLREAMLRHYAAGRYKEAESSAKEIINRDPEHKLAWKVLASTLQSVGSLLNAVDAGEKAVALAPDDAEAFQNLGNIYLDLKRHEKARACFEGACSIRPEWPESINNLGIANMELGLSGEAEQCFTRAISLDISFSQAHYNLGSLMQRNSRFAEAARAYATAIEINPNYVQALINLAVTEKNLGRWSAAEEHLKSAIRLDSAFAVEAHSNLGMLFVELGELERAESHLIRAIDSQPNHAEANFALGGLRLQNLDFGRGFDLYEWRWQTKDSDGLKLQSSKPLWAGERGKTVLVLSEQGIGDVIMFASVIPDLLSVCAAVTVSCDPRLVKLFKRSFSGNINFYSNSDQAVPEELYDFQVPIGSLPKFFRRDLEHFQSRPFLFPSHAKKDGFRRKLNSGLGKLVCGIAWRGGSSTKAAGVARSIDLRLLAETLDEIDIRLVNLQYGDVTSEINDLKESSGIDVISIPEVDNFKDLDGLSAVISACDFVVSIDNSTVHLAGALGVPTIVLLPFAADWRWNLGRKSCYWYNSLMLFRQESRDNWEAPLAELKLELGQVLNRQNRFIK